MTYPVDCNAIPVDFNGVRRLSTTGISKNINGGPVGQLFHVREILHIHRLEILCRTIFDSVYEVVVSVVFEKIGKILGTNILLELTNQSVGHY